MLLFLSTGIKRVMDGSFSKFIRYYLPAFLWTGVIFYFSSVPDLKVGAQSISAEIILRKLGHIIEFAVLYGLVFRIFFYGHRQNFKKSIGFSLIVVILYAISDECHQTFTPGRTGKIVDVVFDAISAILGLQIINIYIRRKINFLKIISIIATVILISAMEFGMIKNSEKIEEKKKIENYSTQKQEPVLNSSGAAVLPETPQEKNNNIPKDNLPENKGLPPKIKIDVFFTSQAPLGKWDAYHEEACEEASLIMVKYYLDGKKLTPDTAEAEIQKTIAYEIKNYGDYKDTDAQENVKLAKDFYGITNLKVVYAFKAEDIKAYLAKGEPIIVPAAGRELGNPNFTPPGPLYHNLVLVGYDGNTIITNDPGTRKGEGYRYDINILYNAIHDFPGKPENINQGRKAMIVID